MKNSFPEFDSGAEIDHQMDWSTALFVFDSNVLLNLYRYQPDTGKQLLDVLDKLSDQIWIPHQVALEFQRNRLSVMADQNNKFSEVRNVINRATIGLKNDLAKLQLERRHTLIDPKPVLEGFEKLAKKFLSDLKNNQKGQQKVNRPDPLKSRLEDLFDGRVGEAPADQKQLDEIYKTADRRFSSKIPPGYMDVGKDQKGPLEYLHRGLYYQRKYGDYLVWHQLLQHTKTKGVKGVVFVTDDAKEDWWWEVESDGPNTLGPRPELQDEAKRVGGINSFKMYRPERFMNFAKNSLQTKVSNEALEEVRDVSSLRRERDANHRGFVYHLSSGERAVLRWLERRFQIQGVKTRNTPRHPSFTVGIGDHLHGVEVRLHRIEHSFRKRRRLRYLFERVISVAKHSALNTFTLFVLLPSMDEALEAGNLGEKLLRMGLPATASVVVAALIDNDSTVPDIELVSEFVGTKGISLLSSQTFEN